MTGLSKALEDLATSEQKQRAQFVALRRWVAAIREALLHKLTGRQAGFRPHEHEVERIKRDLNQCERLLGIPYIADDPVLEIWLKDKERASVHWLDFEPSELGEQWRKSKDLGR